MRYISGKITGATCGMCWSVRSRENSVKTLIAPCTGASSPVLRAAIKRSNRPHQFSGQSQWAMADIAYATEDLKKRVILCLLMLFYNSKL